MSLEEIEKYKGVFSKKSQEWKKNKDLNRIGAYGVSVAIILFGFVSSIVGLTEVDIPNKKVWAGITGSLILAVQGIGETFKFKTREEKYRIIQKQVEGLIAELDLIARDGPDLDKELLNLKERFKKLNDESAT
ncbi:hypothetical protein NSTC745_00766 [Nostoc sp. DSM 114161]|jgi:hypothetical protein|uniref:hypothetical protein n=1 Tax=Nostoc sp. DSM 114161 TaxID=3440143 RepID=UPI0040461C55